MTEVTNKLHIFRLHGALMRGTSILPAIRSEDHSTNYISMMASCWNTKFKVYAIMKGCMWDLRHGLLLVRAHLRHRATLRLLMLILYLFRSLTTSPRITQSTILGQNRALRLITFLCDMLDQLCPKLPFCK